MKSCSVAVEKKIRQSTDALNMLSILPWFRYRVRVRVRVRVVIRAYEQVVRCACAACCWCATMRLVSWMKLSRFADEKLFGCG